MTPSLRLHPSPARWLAFVDGGGLQVRTGKVEIGQSLHAALAGWVAQRLEWPIDRVQVLAPDTALSPDEGVTSGSLSMQDSGRTLAAVASIVRRRLVDAAAARWGVDPASVECRDGVLAGPGGRREPVSPAMASPLLQTPVTADEWQGVQHAPSSGVEALAQAARHAALASAWRGPSPYLQDLVLPDLLHGCVLHVGAPIVAGRPGVATQSPADAPLAERLGNAVRAMPGVMGLVVDGGLVGLLADGAGRAVRAARRLSTGMKDAGATTAQRVSGGPLADLADLADPLDPAGWAAGAWPARWVARHPAPGEAAEALPSDAPALSAPPGGQVRSAVFTRGWLAHASIGPSCAIARWSSDGAALEVWTHSQGVFNLRRDLALAWGLDEQAVVVRHVPGAGCYGHNGADDVAFDASWLARHAMGRPVRVEWLREQEWRCAPLGPAMRVEVQAALDAQGRIVQWRHALWSPGHSSRPGRCATPSLRGNALRRGGAPLPAPIDMPLATGGGAERNAVPGYAWPAWDVIGHRVDVPWRASALRSLGAHLNVYAAESLLDEVAHIAGQCPWSLRLQALGHDPRGAAVLRLARERSRWDARRAALQAVEGAGLGVAYARYKNTGAWCAVIAEVRAEARLRVVGLTVVADVGLPVHPEGVCQQLEGGAVQATSWTLRESVSADAGGGVAPMGWEDYPIQGFGDVPALDVHLMPSTEAPLGAGEAACGPTAAAIGNALFDALGVRVRDLPLTPERIVAAMAA